MAEEVGFEPTDPFRGQHISSVLLSTTQPLFQNKKRLIFDYFILTTIFAIVNPKKYANIQSYVYRKLQPKRS
jgi:hypothetical protein